MCPTFLKKSFGKEDSEASKRVGGCAAAAAAAVISLDAFCKPLQSFAHQEEHCNEANCIK